MAASVALVALVASGCGTRAPSIWSTARPLLPAEVDRVVYADLDALAGSKLGHWVLRQAGQRLGDDCRWDRGEVLWVSNRSGRSILFVRRGDNASSAAPAPAAGALEQCAAGMYAMVVAGGAGVWALSPDQSTLATFTTGRGALAEDPRFAEGLVNVDYRATVWAVARSRNDDARGMIALNVYVRGGGVEVDLRLPAGTWARAFTMARALGRQLARREEYFTSVSVDAEGSDVIVRAWIREEHLENAMDELLR